MTTEAPKETPPALLTGQTYDRLKFAVTIGLPALGTLYFALASIWGLPAAQQVLGSIVALEAFLGALLGISTRQYEASGAKYSGAINISQSEGKTLYSLDLDHEPEKLNDMSEVSFKVNQPPPEPKAVYQLSQPAEPPQPSQPSQ